MDFAKHYLVNDDHAENGKWFDLEDGGRVKVARLGNRHFKAEVARLQKSRVTELRVNGPEVVDQITTLAMAKTILLDWENFKMAGEDIPYSREKAEELLFKSTDFREAISVISVDKNNYALDDIAGK